MAPMHAVEIPDGEHTTLFDRLNLRNARYSLHNYDLPAFLFSCPACPNQGPVDRVAMGLILHGLRMPLDEQAEPPFRPLHSLSNPVLAAGDNLEAIGQLFDRLVMVGMNTDLFGAEYLRQEAAPLRLHPFGLAMIDLLADLRGDVLDERAARHYI